MLPEKILDASRYPTYKYHGYTEDGVKYEGDRAYYKDYIILDNLSEESMQFKSLTDSAKNASQLIPGEDILIEINASCAGEKALRIGEENYGDLEMITLSSSQESNTEEDEDNEQLQDGNTPEWWGYKQVNSLFNERLTVSESGGENKKTYDLIKVSCGRHLQNLDAYVSGMYGTDYSNTDFDYPELYVEQTDDINFGIVEGNNKCWAAIYNDLKFRPITNEKLVSFDGGAKFNRDTLESENGGYEIQNLIIDTKDIEGRDNNFGLFGTFFGKEIKNVCIRDAEIDRETSGIAIKAGMIAGYVVRTGEDAEGAESAADGSSEDEAKDATVHDCIVINPVLMISCSDSLPTFVGGAIGYMEGENSIKDVDVYGLLANGTVNGTATYKCGGVIGGTSIISEATSKKIEVENCHARRCVIYASGAGSNDYLGGVIGTNEAGELNVKECSAQGVYVDSGSKTGEVFLGGFAGSLSGESALDNCAVFITEECFNAYGTSGLKDGYSDEVAKEYIAASGEGTTKISANEGYWIRHSVESDNSASVCLGGLVGQYEYSGSGSTHEIKNCFASTVIFSNAENSYS